MLLRARHIEETGGANFLFVTKDGKLVTPKSDILPSITRRSCHDRGASRLHDRASPGQVRRLKDFAEAGLCGTAAIICPVGKVSGNGETIEFPSGMKKWVLSSRNSRNARGIQLGTVEAPEKGWIREIK